MTMKATRRVLDHSLLRSNVRSHRSLIRLLCTARFAQPLARSAAHSLSSEFMRKQIIFMNRMRQFHSGICASVRPSFRSSLGHLRGWLSPLRGWLSPQWLAQALQSPVSEPGPGLSEPGSGLSEPCSGLSESGPGKAGCSKAGLEAECTVGRIFQFPHCPFV